MPVERLMRHVELRHRQFAAGDDGRAADANPALVALARIEQAGTLFERRFLVVHGIEEAEDFAVDADGAGHPDFPAEGGGDSLGDAALAVARRTEQEQPSARVDRRPEPVEHVLAEQQALEGVVQILDGGMLARQRLGVNAGDVILQARRAPRRSRCSAAKAAAPRSRPRSVNW